MTVFTSADPFAAGVCRGCGCTEDNACVNEVGGTCAWAEPGLCTACDSRNAADQRRVLLYDAAGDPVSYEDDGTCCTDCGLPADHCVCDDHDAIPGSGCGEGCGYCGRCS